MTSHQTKNAKNAGFTLVEIMVVILIFAILLVLGNYGNITQRRERARIEELTVEIITLIDQEKVDTLLGKTISGAIVRKRKVVIDFDATSKTLTYKSYANLVKDSDNLYYSSPANTSETALHEKSWAPLGLVATLINCDSGNPVDTSSPLIIELQGDTMSFLDKNNKTIKHIVIQLSRQGSYREIHIDRRTGVTFEREGVSSVKCN